MIEKQFNLQLSDLQKLPRRNVDGKRLYETPDGSFYPSVTTITGQMTKKAIQASSTLAWPLLVATPVFAAFASFIPAMLAVSHDPAETLRED